VTRVHVWGASGYAAAEVIRLLHSHPSVELGILESHSHAGELLADHFPLLRATPYCFDEFGSVVKTASAGDVVITAGRDAEACAIVPSLLSRGARVIDLSAFYRSDATAVYGLAEWRRDAIADAQLVANPGCYPTAALLSLLPLAATIDPSHIVIDAKSGISGAGRTPSVGSLFAEVSGDIRAYGLNGHRHQPEIERYLSSAGFEAKVTFTPHVVPIARGMLVNAYVFCRQPADAADVAAAYVRAYGDSTFVHVLSKIRVPSVVAVNGTNDAELRVDIDETVVRTICAIDNLGKGAAGQAVQNLNIMLGYPEERGLHDRAIVA
jgi:N-acetyl-gamma-glutamyl-phosphate reductase